MSAAARCMVAAATSLPVNRRPTAKGVGSSLGVAVVIRSAISSAVPVD